MVSVRTNQWFDRSRIKGMKFRNDKYAGLVNLAKALVAFIFGGLVVHLMVMYIDHFLMLRPLVLDLRNDLPGVIFSAPMVPMITAYGLLSLLIYLLWEKKKRALLLARERTIQKEKVDAVLKSMQHMTGLLAEHIAMQNAQILSWIELRNETGKMVSEKVEVLSKNIARALQALSETSFVVPFAESRPENIDEIVGMLESRLSEGNPNPRPVLPVR
jgi:hypothetical protein